LPGGVSGAVPALYAAVLGTAICPEQSKPLTKSSPKSMDLSTFIIARVNIVDFRFLLVSYPANSGKTRGTSGGQYD
jgi:hypothetical protein